MDILVEEVNPRIIINSCSRNSIQFEIHGVDISYVNGLRRAVLNELQTLAIDECVFNRNESVLSDEFIAHRLGLVPIYTDDLDCVQEQRACACNRGCKKCTVTAEIDVTNDTDEPMMVTDKHIQVAKDMLPTRPNGDTLRCLPLVDVDSSLDAIPIIKLNPGASLHVDLTIRKGRGKVHAKWCPVSKCVAKPVPIIVFDDAGLEYLEDFRPYAQHFVDTVCPKGLFELTLDGRVTLPPENLRDCVLCGECERFSKDELPSGVHDAPALPDTLNACYIRTSRTAFLIDIESIGTIPAPDIFKMAKSVLHREYLVPVQAAIQQMTHDAEGFDGL
ncbi:hypothetical protein KIPB_008436 [Kipferlia bialata]|uniref:DNA-directed RNA polymerase RpoA/D/Rpb3-type domain-containing protein n=1 Tax=Kipferlia bialata TaxID=797122 RepID=A0A9K3CYC6_9EUKA|nr:hypothetical protein KIPB_005320 [Kipferlia bialata]GIQ86561.1 hypothetical protein KIPB_008436 [Kipferlia bialata]|eukprot:g5320.t1